MDSIFSCIDDLDIENFKRYIGAGRMLDRDIYGDTILHAATLKRSIELVQEIVILPIDVNATNLNGKTALHYAAELNLFEIAKIILIHKGVLNISDNYGNEPLWTAVFNVKGKMDRMTIVELFLQNGANKNHMNNAERSPLDFVQQINFQPLLELLAKY